MPGTLYVVATPIGNLEDLTFRALRILKDVDVIAAEDTRRTSKLLAHYNIRKSMISLREHNERRETPRLVARLLAGQSIALVSDAGTPTISDPGHVLVRAAREAGIQVSPIPGPSAVMAALSATGVPADQFVFMGFPPTSGRDRQDWFKALGSEERTVVFFEAPHRIEETLSEVVAYMVNRPIYVHRELTKINESLVVYTSNVTVKPVGEFVCVVPELVKHQSYSDLEAVVRTGLAMFDCMTETGVFGEDKAENLVCKATGIDAASLRKALKRARIARKRQEEALS